MLVTYRIESTSNWLRLINLSAKRAGERSAGNLHAPFDVAGDGNQLTVRLVRHSQRKRGGPDRSDLRSMAPFLDPTRARILANHRFLSFGLLRDGWHGPIPDLAGKLELQIQPELHDAVRLADRDDRRRRG